MSEKESNNSDTDLLKTLQEQSSNLNNNTHDEISNLRKYIDQKIIFSIQNYSQSIDKINLRLDKLEEKIQQNEKLNHLNNNEIASIKQQLIEIKSKVNNENSKLNQIVEEKVAANSEEIIRMSKIIDCRTKLYDINNIEELKCEMKKLKELLSLEYENYQNRDTYVNPISELKNDQFSYNFLQDENNKIKTNLKSIKSEIKQIITKALSNDNTSTAKNPFDDIQIELSETSPKNQTTTTTDDYESTTLNESQSIDQIESIQLQITETTEKVNEIKEKINQISSENISIKSGFNSLKKLIDQNQTIKPTNETNEILYKAIDATFAANEAQSKSVEANSNSIKAQIKADDAVFRAAEAESKAISANEKSDRIVSDNDKMNVDIKCLKYEVKKLRLKVKEFEESEAIKSSTHQNFVNEIEDIKLNVKHIKSDLQKLKETNIFELNKKDNESKNQVSHDLNDMNEISQIKNEIKSIKSDIKKIDESLVSSEFEPIQEYIIQKVKDVQTQSSHAFDKASITFKEVNDLRIKTNEIIEKLNKVRTDVHNLKSDVKKMKELHNDDNESKTQKKEDKKKKVN